MTMTSNMALQFVAKKHGANQIGNGWRIQIDVEDGQDYHPFKDSPRGTRWAVVVVRMDENDDAIPPQIPEDLEKEKVPFDDMGAVQQAGILCGRSEFQEFLSQTRKTLCVDDKTAAEKVRQICNVGSRSELGTPDNVGKWLKLRREYEQWQTDKIAEALQR